MARSEKVPHILLVEDDDVDAEAVRRVFRKANIANPLKLVRDGVEALSCLREEASLQQPCVVLLDINMPRMNGLQLLEEMRNCDTLKRNVVFMLTTSARDEDLNRAYDLSAAGYILKENLGGLADLLGSYCRINELPPGR